MKRIYMSMLMMLMCISSILAADVKVTMNTTSTTMTLADKATGAAVEIGEPASRVYSFTAPAGTYVLTAYATNGTTVNGTIEINVEDGAANEFSVLTCTAYATNSGWTADNDYTVEVDVNTREGVKQVITIGNSSTAGRKTFLALNGNSYYAQLIPNAEHQAEGYMTLYKGGTLTNGVNVNGAIPTGGDYTITMPKDAELYLGIKFAHFLKYQEIAPSKSEVKGDTKEVTYHLANSQQYNYRTWKTGGLTQAGYFTFNTDETKCPQLAFAAADYDAFGAKTVKHDVKWNGGYETGDIFVNINERGHLAMNIGDTYDAHAMRTWQLTDNSTNNYFMEPDFHYTVIGLDGKPSTGVIEIDTPDTTTDPWSVIKAVGKGTAIVLVTYDAIGLNYYSNATKSAYMGGEYWSAIWPENTAAYVVTVGEDAKGIEPNMYLNEDYNTGTLKVAGKNVDAEHDVFYYLDTEEGAEYTFTPGGVESVEIAYPAIGEQMATYNGFSATGVTKNEDGSYTLLLKHGRQIVRLSDASGNAVYQVLTAKKAHRDITNATRPGSKIFQPGDEVKIQYDGLFHPSNKLAGIYNMSAYVTYNGTPNGSSLILGSGQYTFGSAASAQAVTVKIPADQDPAQPVIMSDGVIQVNGFGDPIGNHRYISRACGRSANFTAAAHKTYFGMIPDVRIELTAVRNFVIRPVNNVEGAAYEITLNGNAVTDNGDGTYTGTYGTYSYTVKKAGYYPVRGTFSIEDNAEGEQTFNVTMTELPEGAWDGETKTQPAIVENVYQISNAAELAWFASTVNAGTNNAKGVLTADIDLAGFDWTPVGGTAMAKAFKGTFDGQGHTVKGLYINQPTLTYQGLFGYTYGTADAPVNIDNLIVEGQVTAKQYAAGIAAYMGAYVSMDCVGNKADVTTAGTYTGGITGYVSAATAKVTNAFNHGNITGTTNVGGVAGSNNATAVIENVYSVGIVSGTTVGAVIGGTTAKTNVKNAFASAEYGITAGQTTVAAADFASGKVAYLLGEAWGQEIGVDALPVIGGMKVLYDEAGDKYYNEAPAPAVADFEDCTVDPATGLYLPEDEEDETCYWNSGDYTFTTYTDDWGTKYYYDFVVTNSISSAYSGLADQYNSAAGAAKNGENYAVWYSNYYGSEGIYCPDAMKVSGFYVTNTAWVVDALINGDGMSAEEDETTGKPFGYGGKEDKLTLVVTGYDEESEETGKVEYTLAEVKGNTLYYVKDWRWVDLTSLGEKVVNVKFAINSTKQNSWGPTTPTYFCMDGFGGVAPEVDAPMAQQDIATAITNLTAATANAQRFDLMGRRVSGVNGIQIIRMGDGSVRKAIVK